MTKQKIKLMIMAVYPSTTIELSKGCNLSKPIKLPFSLLAFSQKRNGIDTKKQQFQITTSLEKKRIRIV